MRSGISPADHLRDLDIDVRVALPVGNSFQDHPIAAFPIGEETSIMDFHTNCCARYTSDLGGARPGDMMLVAMNRLGDGLGHTRAPTPNFGLIGALGERVFSRGSIRLASADPLAQPIVEENMLDDPSDLLRSRRNQASDRTREPAWIRRHRRIHRHRRLDRRHRHARQRHRHRRMGVAERRRRPTRHQQLSDGCCGQPLGVVDPNCRTRRSRLRVIDASVMPSVPCAGTHLTTVMIAEHMADRLRSA